MEEVRSLVVRSARGAEADRLAAFGELVKRFQDMAYGYAYAILGDFHLAEDAAQEAFLTAYRRLGDLKEPEAFPGWLRRIVQSSCNRLTRRKALRTAPLDAAAAVASSEPGPPSVMERKELRAGVLAAVRALPPDQREVTTLYYVNGYSHADIADFLSVPVTTVNNRLHASRKRLKERMVAMVADEFRTHPLPPEFPERIRLLLELPRPLEIEGHPVRELWQAFRACFPDFEVVDLEEVSEKSVSLLQPRHEDVVYEIDSERMLRPELTSQIIDRWLGVGGAPKWLTVGRVFRKHGGDTERRLSVFHQAEVLWAEEGLDEARFHETMLRVAAGLLPGIDCRPGAEFSYTPVQAARCYECRLRGDWVEVAGGGMFTRDWVQKCGLDPDRYGVMGFAFGLERTAQVRWDLDDARKLWQPPYVPE